MNARAAMVIQFIMKIIKRMTMAPIASAMGHARMETVIAKMEMGVNVQINDGVYYDP